MAAATESPHRNVLVTSGPEDPMATRIVPVPTPKIEMSAPSPGEPMDVTTPTANRSATMTPSRSPETETNGSIGRSSPPSENHGTNNNPNPNNGSSMGMPAPPAAAAAAVHQPKIVQTAFIHKLYNMLEDPSIQHLISWSPSAESFVMSPSADFSKVLAQYFKHTNISSFVRQLNMYGFHKVSDVFHTGSPEAAHWEFKHGNGNFKRGDLVGLREIKRRASRHALVHREYSSQKPTPSQPGTPAEPMSIPQDSPEARLQSIEHAIYELTTRLQRSEDNAHYIYTKQQVTMEAMARALHINQELSRTVLSLVPADSPLHRDVVSLQGEIQRQTDMLRSMDDPHESPFVNSRQYFSGIENAPVSPRQLPQDDARRLNLAVPQPRGPNNYYRPQVPSNLSITTRRPYGSIGANAGQPSPGSARPPPQLGPHPLANVEPPPSSLARRHTAADIRAHGWQPTPNSNAPPNPFMASGPTLPQPPPQWPPSPNRPVAEDQRIRDSFSSYSLQSASQHSRSRPATPPQPPFANGGGPSAPGSASNGGPDMFSSWSWGSAGRDNKNLAIRDSSGPPTRRGSMAHILNPTDTAERDEEGEDIRGEDDRKRKRMQ